MAGTEPTYYWDSCLFLAWIKDEERPGREMDGVYDVAESISKNHFTLLTSVMAQTEVLESFLTPEAQAKFVALFFAFVVHVPFVREITISEFSIVA